ncbi:hypothetical protein [Cerasicoccus maritimus]|uniref:hypothetical protein n=1 Tax=Cerasicoccus maritimus TaxID=490089 RepID=UPI0028527A7B|nr:hypothetical protein [Cerasicoccus maritimus]
MKNFNAPASRWTVGCPASGFAGWQMATPALRFVLKQSNLIQINRLFAHWANPDARHLPVQPEAGFFL